MAKKLKAVIPNLDGLSDEEKEFYEEGDDGKFYLQMEEFEQHTAAHALNRSLQSVRRELKAAKDKAKELETRVKDLPEDFDRDAYEEFLASRDTGDDDDDDDDDDTGGDKTKAKKDDKDKPPTGKLQRMYEQRIKRQKDSFTEQLTAKDNEITELKGQIATLLIDEGLTQALVENNVDKKFLRASHAMLRGQAKVETGDDGKPVAVVETEDGNIPLKEYVATWVESDEGKPFVIPASGTDAKGNGARAPAGDANNPWKKDTWNLTQQGQIVANDPAKAARLKQQAGVQ